ncbi:HAD-IIIC family phosphatase [Oceanibacterium hippocampi]|uniref:HAD-IIIC family phosphatase n=1 Tax=Oceanibacterium hippocampi TaxID=745714 RepID=A0A1Y5T9S0_9PROT|nr:HAD-IIIC family phosphatase [Oceanibacterium hippocampi]SLN55572.1 hypothetical protein OCH7691_02380 [Oceanibacterium hippocampi]
MDIAELKTAFREIDDPAEALARLATVDFDSLKPGEISFLHRKLKRLAPAPGAKIAYLGNLTVEPLPDYVDIRAACGGLATASHVGAFGQHYQEVMNPASGLHAFAPDLILLTLSLRELAPDIAFRFSSLDGEQRAAERNRIVGHVADWLAAAKNATQATILVANFPVPAALHAGIADLNDPDGERAFYARLNLDILELCRETARATLFDLDRLVARVGTERAFSPRLTFLARREWDEHLLPAFAGELFRYLVALKGLTRKCLVLDLDNTLWGGVVGEEGPDGVKVGPGDPVGEAFLAFQHGIVALKERGVILGIASKNNPADVEEVFARRPGMPLRLEDFSAVQVNWNHKHESLKAIAASLNIGIDSLVFLDDNPVECGMVREMLPEVKVVQMPDDPALYLDCLRALPWFERLSITGEDRAKARQYLENQKRDVARETTGDLNDYLKSLGTEVIFRHPVEKDADRIHQLFTKTNQFNTTTMRYSPADVERFMTGDRFDIRVADVRDRFGELGTVGLILIDREGEVPAIDSFVMSCRAMGREIESAIVNSVKEEYLLSGRYPALECRYVPTRKNQPVAELYESQGFIVAGRDPESGAKNYRLAAENAALLPCDHIQLTKDE